MQTLQFLQNPMAISEIPSNFQKQKTCNLENPLTNFRRRRDGERGSRRAGMGVSRGGGLGAAGWGRGSGGEGWRDGIGSRLKGGRLGCGECGGFQGWCARWQVVSGEIIDTIIRNHNPRLRVTCYTTCTCTASRRRPPSGASWH